jgi:uncharacterized short protein YbdD (DUF466 family)
MAGWKKAWSLIWEYLKEASGERQYDHYVAWAKRNGISPIARDEFFLSRIEARYSRPNRCC